MVVAAIVMAIAVACWLSARIIPATGAAAPDLVVTRNPWTSTWALIRDVKSQKRLWDGTLIVSWFWLAGAVTLSVLPTLVSNVIGGAETVFTLCWSCSRSASRWAPAWPRAPAISGPISRSCRSAASSWRRSCSRSPGPRTGWPGDRRPAVRIRDVGDGVKILVDLFGIAIGGGIFVVPSFAAVQAWAAPNSAPASSPSTTSSPRRSSSSRASSSLSAGFRPRHRRHLRDARRRDARSRPAW